MKNRKIKTFIIYFIFIIIIFLSLFFVINDKNNNNKITKKVKELSNSISKIIYYPVYFNKKNNLIIDEENKVLRDEIKEYKKTLKIKENLTDRKLENAVVIKRSTSYFYNIITINKGEKNNIKIGNLAINNDGVIGTVIKVNKNSSDIKLLTSKNKNNYLSVMFKYENNYYYGLIDNYDIKKNELHIKNVIGDFNDMKDIEVYTSGLTNNSAKGLLIGKIKSYSKDQYGISNNIYVTPTVNFNNLNIVTIIVR